MAAHPKATHSPAPDQPRASAARRDPVPPARSETTARIVIPIGYSAWLNGDLGATLERRLTRSLDDAVPTAKVTRMPRGFLVEADESPGPLLEAVQRATSELEASVAATYPVLHHQIGPLWTGTLQAVFA